jgi:DUF4097 and DUF4098 domain-containing protein YvlB
MKRIVIVLLLVLIAGIAGIVRSSSHGGTVAGLRNLVSHEAQGDVRDEIRRTFELSPGATVDISGINGTVKIETSETKTAEVFIERKASSPEALQRRKINVEADASSLRISSEKGDSGFFSRLFGSSGSETVTLKLPREISLRTKGVNGSLIVGEITGSVEVRGVNGRVQISGASGTADFKGINGNISVGLKELERDGVSINGVNGNIELRLGPGLNADLDANGMNGRVISEIPGVTVEQYKHGKYSAVIGTGGNAISVKGINGNIRLTRTATPTTAAAEAEAKADSK